MNRLAMAIAFAGASMALAWSAPIVRADAIAGVVPDQPTGMPSLRLAPAFAGPSLDYQGGPVMHSNRTHVIFWNPSKSGPTPLSLTWDMGYQAAITGFLTNVAADNHKATNVYGLTPQYTDGPLAAPTGRAFYDSSFAGPLQDTDVAPANGCTLPAAPPVSSGPTMPDGTLWPVCLSEAQLINELATFVANHGLPTGLGDIYFLVTPDGLGSCAGTSNTGPNSCSLGGFGTPSVPITGSYCGFHTVHNASTDPLLWADIPYNADPPHCNAGNPRPNGSADPSIGSLSHEHNETITDPVLNAWINGDFSENGDLCALKFGPPLGGSSGPTAYNQVIGTGHYLIQDEWSNEDAGGSSDPSIGCKASDESDSLSFSLPGSVPPGSTVTLNPTATDPDGSILNYAWNFGDGSAPAGGAPASHTYASTGVYQITLTTTDIGGELQSITESLTVDTPPLPRFSPSTAAPIALLPVSFNGSGSSDPDGSVVAYRWSFGDGSAPVTGATPTHAYSRAGTYSAQLTVTDNLGVSASTSRSIVVAPFPRVGSSFRSGVLRITVNGPGTVTVGALRKLVRRAGTVKLAIVLSTRQKRLLHRKHVLKVKLKIVFKPRVGPAIVKTINVTVRG